MTITKQLIIRLLIADSCHLLLAGGATNHDPYQHTEEDAASAAEASENAHGEDGEERNDEHRPEQVVAILECSLLVHKEHNRAIQTPNSLTEVHTHVAQLYPFSAIDATDISHHVCRHNVNRHRNHGDVDSLQGAKVEALMACS